MILTAHQPVYLPWLGLFNKMVRADYFCYFDNVQYQPKDFNNRNKIKTKDGSMWLTVPVLRKGYLNHSYKDIEISNEMPWQRKHWNSIKFNYQKAPFFDKYSDDLKRFYEMDWKYLTDLNFEMLLFFKEKLGITSEVVKMSDYNFRGKKSGLVLDMCRQLDAGVYIFGGEGKNYADVKSFTDMGVMPVFQEYKHPIYPQLHGEFISHLSIIDLLFNCGEQSLDIIKSGWTMC